MIITIIIHNKYDDESHSPQKFMIISITITFSNWIITTDPILIRSNDKLIFLKIGSLLSLVTYQT
jgi:hypothetical protein